MHSYGSQEKKYIIRDVILQLQQIVKRRIAQPAVTFLI